MGLWSASGVWTSPSDPNVTYCHIFPPTTILSNNRKSDNVIESCRRCLVQRLARCWKFWWLRLSSASSVLSWLASASEKFLCLASALFLSLTASVIPGIVFISRESSQRGLTLILMTVSYHFTDSPHLISSHQDYLDLALPVLENVPSCIALSTASVLPRL